jgi:hypothetical protein
MSQILNLIKLGSVGAKLFHANGKTEGRTDGRTDGRTEGHHEANSHF